MQQPCQSITVSNGQFIDSQTEGKQVAVSGTGIKRQPHSQANSPASVCSTRESNPPLNAQPYRSRRHFTCPPQPIPPTAELSKNFVCLSLAVSRPVTPAVLRCLLAFCLERDQRINYESLLRVSP